MAMTKANGAIWNVSQRSEFSSGEGDEK